MIEFFIETLRLIADIMITGGVILGVIALAFEPLISGGRR